MEGIVRSVFDRYDRNRNGVFEKEEWSGFRTDPSAADKDRDGKITRDEMVAWLGSRFGGGRGGGDSGDRQYYSSRDGSDGSDGEEAPRSYRFRSATERMAEGLPDWFSRNDLNADGQIAMAEFSASWSDSVVSDYHSFDLNHDGFITQRECLAAAENGVIRGSTVSTPSSTASNSRASSASSPASTSSAPVASGSGNIQVDPRYLNYYRGLVKKHDGNGDGVLTENEWKTMSRDYSTADTDGNGQITAEELTIWSTKK
jgi:Ca2+-binding EF-hand superfamily protein